MNFVIITHVDHVANEDRFFAYSPYVNEMNIWFKHVDAVSVVAPLVKRKITPIDTNYKHNAITFNSIPTIQFTSVTQSIRSLLKLPMILWAIFKAFKKADHIHLRCPGNIGLLGCLVQILFPKTPKTAKYAGNWDPNATQPKSYRLQKWLLSNTVLTKNMKVLVYGDWENQTKNIKPFFTATFKDSEREKPTIRDYKETLKFTFIGSLVEGKRPLFCIQCIEAIVKQGKKVHLDLYGDGILRPELENYIEKNALQDYITLHGNKDREVIKEALKTTHFLMLPSKSEGWPKVVAEAMFFGAIPIVTKISCVPYMLGNGDRGILIEPKLEAAVKTITEVLKEESTLHIKAEAAVKWSQHYTLDLFESETKQLVD